MRFFAYFNLSVGAMLGIVAYAVYTREQFYPTILFLVTSMVAIHPFIHHLPSLTPLTCPIFYTLV